MNNLFKIIIGSSLLFITSSLYAVEVLKVLGKVTIAGQEITAPGKVEANEGIIETGPNSFVRIRFEANESLLTVGPDSKIKLEVGKTPEHVSGSILFKFLKKEISKSPQAVLKTKTAAFGIRGTEFMSVSNSLLGETEIITFESEVLFKSLINPKDRKVVRQGQWGGIGGRFGTEIGTILDLPPNVIEHFKNSFEF